MNIKCLERLSWMTSHTNYNSIFPLFRFTIADNGGRRYEYKSKSDLVQRINKQKGENHPQKLSSYWLSSSFIQITFNCFFLGEKNRKLLNIFEISALFGV